MKKVKRLLAILLVMVMMLSLCNSSVFAAGNSYAGGRGWPWGWSWSWDKNKDKQTEQETTVEEPAAPEVTETEEAAPEEIAAPEETEDAAEPEEAEEIAAPEEAEEAAEPEEAEEAAEPEEAEEAAEPEEAEEAAEPEEAEEAAEPEEAEEAAEPEEAEEAAEPEEAEEAAVPGEEQVTELTFPAVNGVTVRVVDPEKVLPEGAYLEVKPVDLSKVQDAVDNADDISGTVIAAVDITFFDKDGNSIEEDLSGKVKVFMTSEEILKVEDPDSVSVVHVPMEAEELEELETVEIAAEVVEDQLPDEPTDVDEVAFAAQDFSIYAVVGDGQGGDNARAKVIFHGLNDAEVATYYVKNSDQLPPEDEDDRDPTVQYLDTIVTDPGVGGDVPNGQVFLGWYIGETKNYTTTTPASEIRTIAKVREYLAALDIKEGDVVNVWAVIFKVFTVTYLDEQNISMGTDEIRILPEETSASYRVSKTYTPVDPTKNFEGWDTTDTAKISNAKYNDEPVDKPYKMGTTMTISGDIVFTADAPKGNWLVFDENGKGATYNAPQFVKNGHVTVAPTTEMKRLGYEFGGWYSNPECTGDPFEFGHEINARTTIYAKWTEVATAPYVVLIWKQNVSGNGYDFAASKTQTNATVNASITVTHNNSRVTVTGGGQTYTYNDEKGFKYASADTGKTVSPQGNTIVNVYYDRETVTFNFYVYGYSYTKVDATSIGYNGSTYYIPDSTQSSGYRAVSLRRRNGVVYIDNGDWWSNWQRFTGDLNEIYTRSNNQSWTIVQTMTGLYGSTLEENGYTWPTNYDWYLSYSNGQGSGTRRTFMDAFIPAGVDGMTHNFYASESSGSATITFYKQNENLNGYTVANTVKASSNTSFTLSDKYNGFKLVSYSTNGTNYSTNIGTPNSQGYYNSVNYNSQLHIRYDRKVYSILFKDGIYVDGNDNRLNDQPNLGQLKVVENIAYGASTSSYNKGQANYYDPSTDHTISGFVFEGWYIDDTCTSAYTFTTMPEGITVYAKWRQIQYRVFLHPNASLPDGTDDPSLDWGDREQPEDKKQAMNFRVSYMDTVSVPTGLRDEYEFIGWFTDEATTIPYDPASKLTEQIVTADYDKTDPANYTDKMDQYGHIIQGTGSNSDLTGWNGQDRYWITKKLDLYGKWGEVLTGAIGVAVTYDKNGGTWAPTDTKKYKDNIDAIAGTAATPKEGERFLYWVVQKYNATTGEYEDTTTIVYPGAPFTVHKSWAKETDLTPDDDDYEVDDEGNPVVYKAYTMQLRAEYGPAEAAEDTHITWYGNGGANSKTTTGSNIINEDVTMTYIGLKINEAVNIPSTTNFTRQGYKFLGWAKVTEPTGAFIPATGTTAASVDESKYTQTDTGLTLWLQAKDNGKYDELNADGTVKNSDITQVAADEALPYDALYAVWEAQYFYLFHSYTGELEAVLMADSVDLRDYVSSGALYGGYYSAYGAYTVTDANKEAAKAEKDLTVKVTENTYDGKSLKVGTSTTRYWTKTDAYTAAGNELEPTLETVYYVKEVPTCYLQTNARWIYDTADNNKINAIYMLTGIDDTYYTEVGFEIIDVLSKGRIVSSFSYQQRNSSTVTKVTAAELIGQRGYLGLVDASSYIGSIDSEGIILMPYWQTLDGVIVETAGCTFSKTADGDLTTANFTTVKN